MILSVSLQWSHVLSDMETIASIVELLRFYVASMEPCPFGHGNANSNRALDGEALASMEPRPFGHGNRGGLFNVKPIAFASMEPRPFGDGNQPGV